eukprot:1547522-Rhodomonas_salina.1
MSKPQSRAIRERQKEREGDRASEREREGSGNEEGTFLGRAQCRYQSPWYRESLGQYRTWPSARVG